MRTIRTMRSEPGAAQPGALFGRRLSCRLTGSAAIPVRVSIRLQYRGPRGRWPGAFIITFSGGAGSNLMSGFRQPLSRDETMPEAGIEPARS